MKRIIISRTDNIGDVVLTLPMAGLLKKKYPQAIIYFIGKKYTAPVINACSNINFFLDRDEILASPDLLFKIQADAIIYVYPDKEIAKIGKAASIKLRIGTSHRLFHWFNCNKLINFSRKNSLLHEVFLNFKLLQPFQINLPELSGIPVLYGLNNLVKLREDFLKLIDKNKISIVLHPKSKGSAREWPLHNYVELINILGENIYQFFITGTQAEGNALRAVSTELFTLKNVTDLTGKLTLEELIAFIDNCQGLVACSTGPLHIASALGINTYGIYPPIKPMHAGRWGAIGKNTMLFSLQKSCSECRNNTRCFCIESITPTQIAGAINNEYEHE